MKTIKKFVTAILLSLISVLALHSQTLQSDYHVGVGLRAGQTSGITLNINTGQTSGLEFIAGFWSNWLSLTGLYEKRASAFNANGLHWYYGAGGHFGFSTGTYYQGGMDYLRGQDYALGIDGTVGLEYKIPEIPVAINFGIKPLIEIYRNGILYFGADPGIGVKFTF